MPIFGADVGIGICFQSSFDTVATIASSAQYIPLVSETFNDQQPFLTSESIRNRVDRGDAFSGPKEVTGEVEAEVFPLAIGFLMKTAFEETATVNSASLNTHTFKPRTSSAMEFSPQIPVSVHKEWGSGANDLSNFYNLNATGMEFSCAVGEFLKVKVPFIGGRNDGAVLGSAPSYNLTNKSPFTWDQCSFSIDGNAVGSIKSFSVAIAEGLEAGHTLNSSDDSWPTRINRAGFRTGTINAAMSFDNTSEYIAFRSDAGNGSPTTRPTVITFTQGTEAQSGYPHALKMDIPGVIWESFEDPVQGVGEVEVSLSGKIQYTVASATLIDITLVDTAGAY